MRSRAPFILALAAVLVLVASVAVGAVTRPTASCTANPAITSGAGVDSFRVTCSVPRTTVTVTQTVTATGVPTTTAPTTSSPTTTDVPTTMPPTTSSPTTTAPAPTGACAPKPSSCGYPDTTNTGATGPFKTIKAGQSGPGWHSTDGNTVIIDGPGTVFEGYLTTGDVNIQATNVTVRNVKNTASGESLGGFALRHATNALIEDVTIAPALSAPRLLVGVKDIYGDSTGTVIRRADISGTSTGVQMDSGLLEDSFIHDLRMTGGDHVNGTTSNGGTSLLTIRHNTVLNPFGQTDAVSLFQDFGAQRNRVIDGNLLAGGGYTIYAGANAGRETNTANIAVTNNRISRMYFPDGGSYGPLAAYYAGNGNSFTGNVWDDTGVPVQP